MQLLTPQIVKHDSEARNIELMKRNTEATLEAAEIIGRLNDARDQEKKEIQRRKTEINTELVELEQRRLGLVNVVVDLENRKEQAIKPIRETIAQGEELIAEGKSRIERAQKHEEQLKEREDEMSERAMQNADDLAEILLKEKDLKKRIVDIETAEEMNRRSAVALSEKWKDYYDTVAIYESEVAVRESKVKQETLANEAYNKELIKKHEELREMSRAINDKYEQLQRTINETQHGK